MPTIAPYGTWRSPITADAVATGVLRFGLLALDRATPYWIEGRPTEGGRSVIVRRDSEGRTVDVIPAGYNARTRVHEYGGGDFLVADGDVYFSNFEDQCLYCVRSGDVPQPITPPAAKRYADGVFDARRGRILCVCEDHSSGGEPENRIVAIDAEGRRDPVTLASGRDFVSSPRLNADGTQLAWLAWDHPNMPWDGTELYVAPIRSDGTLDPSHCVAGGADESIFQPEWSPDGSLIFVSDRTGWWNLYRSTGDGVEPLLPMEAEFGLPQWVFGMSTYAVVDATRLFCSFQRDGIGHLGLLDVETGRFTEIETPYTSVGSLRASGDTGYFIGGSATEPSAIVQIDLSTGRTVPVRRAREDAPDVGYLSEPEALQFPTAHGLTAHGLFYRPRNRDFCGPSDERPPLIVISHGGPTGATSGVYRPDIQFWTSRGFAVLDVNYGGSTGYGRAYRERLKGHWGVVDVDDCANGARYLVERGEADGDRLIIRGGSAGGYTTLAALAFRDVFSAGASRYGVSDLAALAEETHKFESRYLDGLIGPYPSARNRYIERSPIHSVDRLSCPVIFFQGLEDRVVPPNQAERMVEALRKKGIPVAYVPFEGEQHGFRRAENIARALEAELFFYGRVFGFDIADDVKPVPIDNLD